MNNPNQNPSNFWMQIFRLFCRRDLVEELEGDLYELYEFQLMERGKRSADRMIRKEVIRLMRPRLLQKLKTQNNTVMLLSNYIKLAFRNARQYKQYAFINLFGLTVGVTSSLLIGLWVMDESAKDQFHEAGASLYAVKRNMRESEGIVQTGSHIPNPLVEVLKSEYPEVSKVTEMSWPMTAKVEQGSVRLSESGRVVSDNFLDVFSYKLLEGNLETVLSDPKSIVISDRLADKFNNGQNGVRWDTPIGQILYLEEEPYQVSGVFEHPGERSSVQFDWLINKVSFVAENQWVNSWENGSFMISFEIENPTHVPAVASRIEMEIERHTDRVNGERLWIQLYEEQYLQGNYVNGKAEGGRIVYVRVMSAVSVLLLLIAAINYMNLATARSTRRSKEIGLRKVMGAYRSMISSQFMVESLVYVFAAFAISMVLTLLLLNPFGQLIDKDLYYLFEEVQFWIGTALIMVLIGLFAGSYPAIRLSAFSVLTSLRGEVSIHTSSYLRKGLFTFQMLVSFVLLFGAWIVYNQLDYMLSTELGIQKDGIVALDLSRDMRQDFATVKSSLMEIPGISAVTAASGNPIDYGRTTSSAKWEGQPPNTPYEINVMGVADEFVEQMEMEIIAGQDFEPEKFGASATHFLVNETAVKVMQFDDPIGKKLSIWGNEGHIIGVVKDYHLSTFHSAIPPLIIFYDEENVNTALVKIQDHPQEVLIAMEEVVRSFAPDEPMSYVFLEDAQADMYESEIVLSKLSLLFVIIAILIALLGLNGLTAYTSEKRTKELGIRRVHGASAFQLLVLLIKEYAWVILVAFALAIPLGYVVSSDWLDQFVYHIRLDYSYFLLPGLLLLFIGVGTVAFKSLQTTRQNIISSLRNE